MWQFFRLNIVIPLVRIITESGESFGEEVFSIKKFTMHHVHDHVLFPLRIWGMDLSITKHVLMLWIAAGFLMLFLPLSSRSKKLVPHGPANFVEWSIFFLKENIFDPFLGDKQNKYAPYLLTAFYFIITCNLLGLFPFAATATGNIAVTSALAISTFFMVQFYSIRQHGIKGYFSIYLPSGLPTWLKPVIILVEIVGMLTKHFALAIRLFANMFAGHLVIFSILGLIFLFKNYLVAPMPVGMIIFLSLLEVLISLIQAFIFTILSAVFIGMSTSHH